LLGPACVGVFVGQFVGLLDVLAPLQWYSAGFDQCVVLAAIALDGHGHKAGINDLATFELNAKPGQ
jgi:hypothetical protein